MRDSSNNSSVSDQNSKQSTGAEFNKYEDRNKLDRNPNVERRFILIILHPGFYIFPHIKQYLHFNI